MLIDTHCHLDAVEFDRDRDQVAQDALAQGVGMIVVPAVECANFAQVCALAERHAHCAIALGIHPLYVPRAQPHDLETLAEFLARKQAENAPLVAVGEIGLDFFVPGFDRAQQEYYFIEQLKLARRFDLPVILHVRRAVDDVLKFVRRTGVRGGIAHAFNGSRQQAEQLIELGFKLGYGGAMTYDRALRIRDLAAHLPLEAIVLETDAPDMSPAWLGAAERNSPQQLAAIAGFLAELRDVDCAEIAEITTHNAQVALPNLPNLCTPAKVQH